MFFSKTNLKSYDICLEHYLGYDQFTDKKEPAANHDELNLTGQVVRGRMIVFLHAPEQMSVDVPVSRVPDRVRQFANPSLTGPSLSLYSREVFTRFLGGFDIYASVLLTPSCFLFKQRNKRSHSCIHLSRVSHQV